MRHRYAFLAAALVLGAALAAQETPAPAEDADPAAAGQGSDAFAEADPGGASAEPGDVDWREPVKTKYPPTDLFLSDTVQVIINADEARFLESGPSPILNMIGVGTRFPISADFSIAPRIDVFTTYYGWIDGRAMPVDVENRLAVLWGLIIDVPVRYDLGLGGNHAMQFTGGIALMTRLAFKDASVPADEQAEVDSVSRYLWDKARFLYPELGVSYSYKMADWVSFGVSARVLLPIFNLWTGEDLPLWDNLVVGGGIWISFTDFWSKLGKK